MIKVTLLTAVLMSALFSTAQDTTKTTKISEYYIGLSNIVPLDISLKYKRQLKNNTFFKIGLINLSARTSATLPMSPTQYPSSHYAYSAGIEFGLEFRKQTTEKLTFFHGPNVSFRYSKNVLRQDDPALPVEQGERSSQGYSARIPYTLGFLFQLNEHFFLSTEINPGLLVSVSEVDYGPNSFSNSTSTSASFNFSNNSSFLSIAYRL